MRLAAVLVVTALAAGEAHAKDACLTPAQALAFSDFLLASAAPVVAEQCSKNHAAVSGAIVSEAERLKTRFKARGDAAWPIVFEHFIESTDGNAALRDELRKQSDQMRPLVASVSTAAMIADLDEGDCAIANDLVEALSPLDDAQIARLMTSFMRIGASKDGAATGMKLCPLTAAK